MIKVFFIGGFNNSWHERLENRLVILANTEIFIEYFYSLLDTALKLILKIPKKYLYNVKMYDIGFDKKFL